jgi:hypothetical protein
MNLVTGGQNISVLANGGSLSLAANGAGISSQTNNGEINLCTNVASGITPNAGNIELRTNLESFAQN